MQIQRSNYNTEIIGVLSVTEMNRLLKKKKHVKGSFLHAYCGNDHILANNVLWVEFECRNSKKAQKNPYNSFCIIYFIQYKY